MTPDRFLGRRPATSINDATGDIAVTKITARAIISIVSIFTTFYLFYFSNANVQAKSRKDSSKIVRTNVTLDITSKFVIKVY